MAVTENLFTGDGSTVLFSFTFPYLNTTDVKVSLDNVATTSYSIVNATQLQFTTAPANGVAIRIFRETSDDDGAVATFSPGAPIRAADLNNNFTQNRYLSQESANSFVTADRYKLDGIEDGATADQTPAEIKTAYESNADTNAFTDADHTKLDSIEASATADQTASEIKTAYESNSNTNAYTDAEKTKLTGIEASATADQTGAEIKTAYEAEADTNAFTDAEKTKLSGVEASATADQTGAEIKSLYEVESNAFTDAQFTKLSGIETGATADQTDSEIKTAYENNADTNAYTDAEKTKLTGIETGATADQTAAEIRTLTESATDSNVFTDADHTKLNSVATGAEVNVPTNLSYTAGTRELASSTGTNVTLPEAVGGTAAGLVSAADQTALDNLSTNLAAKADLVAGKLNTSQVPDLAIVDYLGAVANESAMTSLTGQKGDWCIRNDNGKVYVITGTDPTDNGDWTALSYPAAPSTNLSYTAGTRELASSTGNNTTLPEVIAGGNSGLMTGAQATKLGAIEASATADQTGAEIKTAYEGEANTNAFTDAEKTKLSGISAGAEVNAVTSVNGQTGAVTVAGNTDLSYTGSTRELASSTGNNVTLPEVAAAGDSGLMTGSDKTKLDGIATGAQVNAVTSVNGQTGAVTITTGNSDKIEEGNTKAEVVDTGSNGHFKVETEGTERLRIDSSGDVGIGTTSLNTYTNYNTLTLNGTSGGVVDFQSNNTDIGSIYPTSDKFQIQAQGSTIPITFRTNATERMRISSAGDVGIGTSDPDDVGNFSRALDISGPLGSAVNVRNNNSHSQCGLFAYYGDDQYMLNRSEIGNLMFYTNSLEKARIDSAGRCMIGTNVPGYSTADDLTIYNVDAGITLHSSEEGYGSLFFADGTSGASAYASYIQYNHNSNYLAIGTDSAERMRIDSVGRVGIGYSSPSHALSVHGYSTNAVVCYLRSGQANFYLQLGNSNNDGGYIGYETEDLTFWTSASGTSTEKLRISSVGAIGIGGANYGTAGQVLTSGGSGAAPSWQTASSGGSSVLTETDNSLNDTIQAISTQTISGSTLFTNTTGYWYELNSYIIANSGGNPSFHGDPVMSALAAMNAGDQFTVHWTHGSPRTYTFSHLDESYWPFGDLRIHVSTYHNHYSHAHVPNVTAMGSVSTTRIQGSNQPIWDASLPKVEINGTVYDTADWNIGSAIPNATLTSDYAQHKSSTITAAVGNTITQHHKDIEYGATTELSNNLIIKGIAPTLKTTDGTTTSSIGVINSDIQGTTNIQSLRTKGGAIRADFDLTVSGGIKAHGQWWDGRTLFNNVTDPAGFGAELGVINSTSPNETAMLRSIDNNNQQIFRMLYSATRHDFQGGHIRQDYNPQFSCNNYYYSPNANNTSNLPIGKVKYQRYRVMTNANSNAPFEMRIMYNNVYFNEKDELNSHMLNNDTLEFFLEIPGGCQGVTYVPYFTMFDYSYYQGNANLTTITNYYQGGGSSGGSYPQNLPSTSTRRIYHCLLRKVGQRNFELFESHTDY